MISQNTANVMLHLFEFSSRGPSKQSTFYFTCSRLTSLQVPFFFSDQWASWLIEKPGHHASVPLWALLVRLVRRVQRSKSQATHDFWMISLQPDCTDNLRINTSGDCHNENVAREVMTPQFCSFRALWRSWNYLKPFGLVVKEPFLGGSSGLCWKALSCFEKESSSCLQALWPSDNWPNSPGDQTWPATLGQLDSQCLCMCSMHLLQTKITQEW